MADSFESLSQISPAVIARRERQNVAIQCLLAGGTVTSAAKAADVARETVYDWLRHDAEFIAALNRARFEQHQVIEGLITGGAVEAVQHLRQTLADESAPRWERQAAAASLMASYRRRVIGDLSADMIRKKQLREELGS